MHFVCIINETVNIVNILKDKLLLAYTSRSNKSLKCLAPEDKVHVQLSKITPNLASIATFFIFDVNQTTDNKSGVTCR